MLPVHVIVGPHHQNLPATRCIRSLDVWTKVQRFYEIELYGEPSKYLHFIAQSLVGEVLLSEVSEVEHVGIAEMRVIVLLDVESEPASSREFKQVCVIECPSIDTKGRSMVLARRRVVFWA